MEKADAEKIAEAVKAAVRAALEPPEEKHEPAKEAEEPKPEKRKYETFEKDGYKYLPLKASSVKDVIDTLNDIYHPDSHDFLACPTCRSIFDDEIKGMGYSIDDKGDVITIKRGKK
jgi:hypothetical protein